MKRLIILLIIGMLIFIVGCADNISQQESDNPQQYQGGGCGVAPIEDSGNINQLPMEIVM